MVYTHQTLTLSYYSPKIKVLLERHIGRINRKILKIEQLEIKLSTLRVVYFISSIFILYALSLFAGNTMVGFVLVASILGFFYLVHHHNAVEESLKSFKFLKEIKSSIAMHNTSKQFADGGEFGFGGEVGISTNTLPPRGPVGLNQLVSYKYVVTSNGKVRK